MISSIPSDVISSRSCPGDSGWCKVEIDGFEGWLRRIEFWGVYAKEVLR